MFDGWRVARFYRKESSWQYRLPGTLSDDGLLWRRRYENAVYWQLPEAKRRC